jgi:hypothetical protein
MDLLDQARLAARRLAAKPGAFVWLATSFVPGRAVLLSLARRKGRARLRAECGTAFAKARLPFNYGEEDLLDALTEVFVRAAHRGGHVLPPWGPETEVIARRIETEARRAEQERRVAETLLDAWLALRKRERAAPVEPPPSVTLLARLARLVRRQ